MNLGKFAAAQYAYGDSVLNDKTKGKAGKVSNVCSTMEPNKDIALRITNACQFVDDVRIYLPQPTCPADH